MPNEKDVTATAAVTTEVEEKFSLLDKKIMTTANWHGFLVRWFATDDAETLESYLHGGFKKSMEQFDYRENKYDEIDRIIFFFSIADGRTDERLLRVPEDKDRKCFLGYNLAWNETWKQPSELRQHLAEKAFNMLCLNFFKTEVEKRGRDDEFGDFWHRLIRDDRLLPVIQNYFRVEKHWSRGISLRNFDYRADVPHIEQQAVNFLLKLARFIFNWKEPNSIFRTSEENKKIFLTVKARVDAAKPWLIEVLSQLRQLDALRKYILDFDQPCLDKLKEIALRTELLEDHVVGDKRLVADVDEACYVGSKAGWFIKEWQLRTKVSRQLEAIRKAKWKKERADQELAEILKNQKE